MRTACSRWIGRVLSAGLVTVVCSGSCALADSTAPAPNTAQGPDAQTVAGVERLSEYKPDGRVSGTVRLWGHGSFKHDFMRKLISAWQDQFSRHQPDVKFDYRMYGTASAVGALYTDAGDIAILGEEISPAAARAFKRARGYAHTDISIATGSVDVNFFDYAHMIFVHKDNPLTQLSMSQLDAVFGAEHRRSKRNIRTWGELGVTGDRASRRIRPYGWKTDVDFALFFRERVMKDSHRWNGDITELEHGKHADGSQYDHGQRILDALSRDPDGIAISNLRYATPDVKALALSWNVKGPWYPPTAQNLITQDYPLVRIIPAIIDRAPGQPVAPATREFLRFLLSREGQRALLEHSGYLPLGERIVAEQLRKLQ